MLLDKAVRTALATRSPTALILPYDVQAAPASDPLPHQHGVVPSGVGLRPARLGPYQADLDAAADVLNTGRRGALLVGQGAYGAVEEITAVAETLGAGVATSLLGKPVLDERLPFLAGVMGHLGTTATTTC